MPVMAIIAWFPSQTAKIRIQPSFRIRPPNTRSSSPCRAAILPSQVVFLLQPAPHPLLPIPPKQTNRPSNARKEDVRNLLATMLMAFASQMGTQEDDHLKLEKWGVVCDLGANEDAFTLKFGANPTSSSETNAETPSSTPSNTPK